MTDHRPFRPLSPRQAQVVELYVQGMTLREVGEQLGISVRTAEHHIERAMDLLPTMPGVSARRRLRFYLLAAKSA